MELMTESAVRRLARRKDCTLQKSRRRNPSAPDYGRYYLINNRQGIVVGCSRDNLGGDTYSTTLEDAVHWLMHRQAA